MARLERVQRQVAVAAVAALLSMAAHAADVPARNAPPQARALREARVLVAERRWAEAERILSAHVRVDGRDADAYNLLGFSLRHLDRMPQALAAYRRALELDPAHLGAHEYIGEAYIRIGDLEQAQRHLDALVRLCPSGCAELEDLRASLQQARRVPAGPPLPPSSPAR